MFVRLMTLLPLACPLWASESAPSPRAVPALVVTLTERIEGRLELGAGAVRLIGSDGQAVTVPETEIIRLSTGRRPLRVRGPHAIGLRGGEVWQSEILNLEGRQILIRSSLFGDHAVPIEDVAILDFAPDLSSSREARRGWLYRESGEPTPGKLLSLDRDRLTIDSPLGVLALPRDGLSYYVLPDSMERSEAPPASRPDPADELRLVDGTLLRGRLEIVEGGVRLRHEVFGEIRLPGDTVREIDRPDPRVVDLVDLAPTSLEQLPLTSGPVREAGLRSLRRAEPGVPPSSTFVKALRVEAHTTVRYAASGSTPRTLRARLEAPREARGVAVVRIGSPNRTLLETRVSPRGAPQRVELRFEAGEAISIEVDFGDAIRFPCAVLLADPLLIQES